MPEQGFILIQTLLLLLGIGAAILLSCHYMDESVTQLQLEQEALQLESLVRAATSDCRQDETIHYPIGRVTCTRTDKGFKMEAILESGQRIEAVVSNG
ncbi:hypothetical protein BLD48_00955 [Exiguobacterium sp. KRL4]|uniref:hypothetical protein n=1 Tax=Exiguobacterium sp. KRL4 TaxID=1914536 RepID=UPI0008F8DA40|nr:hypothetical protein [Exiguobacterium sp. KRL4]OIN68466.1 hypothetical protein BLD48_00955 [Exiguobacterium sp. KRL4]